MTHPPARIRHPRLRSLTTAVLLLTAACGGDAVAGPGGGGGGNTPPPPTGTVPPALVGTWHIGAVANTNIYNPANGAWSAPSGEGNAWTFAADGRYTHAQILQSSFYGCTSRVFAYAAGTFTVTGGEVRIAATQGYMKSEDTCRADWNYEKRFDVAAGAPAYTLAAAEDGRPTLTLRWSEDLVQTFRAR